MRPWITLVLPAIVACNTVDPYDDPPIAVDDAALYRFDDCAQLKGYVADAWLESIVGWRYYGVPMAADAESGAADDGSGPSDYSQTNTQEAGVDEPDIVKTDGDHVYVLQQARPELTIVRSWPVDEAEVVARVAIEGHPNSMFLDGDRVAVFSNIWAEYDERNGEMKDTPYRDGYATRITLVDISDRAAPVVERTLDVDGWMTSARLLGDDLYVVLETWSWMPDELWQRVDDVQQRLPEYPYDGTEEEQAAWRRAARVELRPIVEDVVDDIPVDRLLPRQYETRPGSSITTDDLLACSDVYHPEGLSDPSVLTMTHLDLSRADSELTGTALMASGWTVYASQDNLFVAQPSSAWWWGWGEPETTTHVHRFALGGEASTYTGSGEVPGWLWSQFAMSEHEGYLRVATTDGWSARGEEPPANNLFVLDENLRRVGSVTGFAPGESIYSARFIGEQGYVVTFRQIDPLFTFDLSDPTDPRILGELKIPGFSSYLHPYGEDRLIGVGMDGNDEGQVFGLAINLFDVSDLTKPTRIDHIVVNSDDWTWSEALWNHRAFTLHRDVLNLPIYTWENDVGFSGMLSVAVSEDALSTVGRVGHADLVDDSECLYTWEYRGGETCPDDWWYAAMRRSVVIEDNLLSISDYGIKVTDLNDPTIEHARVLFYEL